MARHVARNLFGDPDPARTEPHGGPSPAIRPDEAVDPAAPLAERMRPRTIDEYEGQGHLVGEGRLVRRWLGGGGPGTLPSLILWGGPGTGKTTLARILAGRSGARFAAISAVLAGVKDLREVIAEAAAAQARGERTVLFVDEIHRFHKGQQDALLAALEDGTIALIGATTENPSFELTGALLSRTRVLTLHPLEPADIATILRRALADPVRGLAARQVRLDEDALALLASSAGGDARVALAALEAAAFAVESAPDGTRRLDRDAVVEALGRARFAYDKGGEEHFNLISALIKSVRNSDSDAALYWLARLLEGGADPVFVARRLCILASEDVGLADPQAILQAAAASQVVQLVGLPEGLYPLAQATVYLARAPKSNALKVAYFAARADAAATSREPVPLRLRNAVTPLMKAGGYGAGYRYAHDDPAAGQMTCLPAGLVGKAYFEAPAPAGGAPPAGGEATPTGGLDSRGGDPR